MENSRDTSQLLAACSRRDGSMTLEEEKEIRTYYLRLMNDLSLSFQDKIDKIKTEISMEYGNLMNYTLSKEGVFYYPGQYQDVVRTKQDAIFSIGRHKENSIVLADERVSRINCLVFVYKEKIVVLDSWSVYGTCVINMKTGQEFRSYCGNRNIMTFGRHDEIIISTIGGDKIINPGSCLECISGPKQVRLSCGHLAICYKCYLHLFVGQISDKVCPECKTPINNLVSGDKLKVYLPPTVPTLPLTPESDSVGPDWELLSSELYPSSKSSYDGLDSSKKPKTSIKITQPSNASLLESSKRSFAPDKKSPDPRPLHKKAKSSKDSSVVPRMTSSIPEESPLLSHPPILSRIPLVDPSLMNQMYRSLIESLNKAQYSQDTRLILPSSAEMANFPYRYLDQNNIARTAYYPLIRRTVSAPAEIIAVQNKYQNREYNMS